MPPRPDRPLTFLDRHGPDGALRLTTIGMGVFAGAITTALVASAALVPPVPAHWMLRALVAGFVAGVGVYLGAQRLADGAGAAFLAFLFPSGAPRAPEYSRLEALAARGDVAGAIAAFEAVIIANPGEASARLRAAELHVRNGNPRRAEALLREILRQPARTDAHDLRASNRLVDLYLGPLDEPGKALAQLRRIADEHAGTPVGDGAREAIAAIKARSAAA